VPHLLHRNFAWVYPHSRSVQVRAFVLYGHHTRLVTSVHWITQDEKIREYLSSAADFALTYFTTSKRHLVALTVLGVTITKFKHSYALQVGFTVSAWCILQYRSSPRYCDATWFSPLKDTSAREGTTSDILPAIPSTTKQNLHEIRKINKTTPPALNLAMTSPLRIYAVFVRIITYSSAVLCYG
jgi:hypothetical protein